MTSVGSWLLPAAVGATVALAALSGQGGGGGLALGGSLLAPVAVPLAWVAARLAGVAGRPLLSAAAAATILAAALGGPWPQGLVFAGFVVAGLAGGWALQRGWPAWRAVALGVLCLLPGFFVTLGGVSVPDAFAALGENLRTQYVEGLPEEMPAAERTAAVAAFDETLAGSLQLQRRLWPNLVVLGLAVQAVLFLGLGWGLARVTVPDLPPPAIGSFLTWRAPFASVWALIGGLVLSLLGAGTLADLGWNLVLAAGLLLVVQGVAVQAWLVRRLLPPIGRVMFWVAGLLLLAPVILFSGGLVGLADQWWDLRRLRRPSDQGPR